MASCCQCLLPASRVPPNLAFSNSTGSAVGDAKIPLSRRLYLGVVFPADCGVRPIYMFFSLANEGTKVLEAACAAAGLRLDRGRIVGSPERLNLFTLEGDLLRLDLDLEAHIPSTLQPHSWGSIVDHPREGTEGQPHRRGRCMQLARGDQSGRRASTRSSQAGRACAIM